MRTWGRAIECATLFWLVPGLAWACDLRHEKRLVFAAIAGYCLVLLWRSRTLHNAALWRVTPRDLRGMTLRVAAVAVGHLVAAPRLALCLPAPAAVSLADGHGVVSLVVRAAAGADVPHFFL